MCSSEARESHRKDNKNITLTQVEERIRRERKEEQNIWEEKRRKRDWLVGFKFCWRGLLVSHRPYYWKSTPGLVKAANNDFITWRLRSEIRDNEQVANGSLFKVGSRMTDTSNTQSKSQS